jgi:hypothetical protein
MKWLAGRIDKFSFQSLKKQKKKRGYTFSFSYLERKVFRRSEDDYIVSITDKEYFLPLFSIFIMSQSLYSYNIMIRKRKKDTNNDYSSWVKTEKDEIKYKEFLNQYHFWEECLFFFYKVWQLQCLEFTPYYDSYDDSYNFGDVNYSKYYQAVFNKLPRLQPSSIYRKLILKNEDTPLKQVIILDKNILIRQFAGLDDLYFKNEQPQCDYSRVLERIKRTKKIKRLLFLVGCQQKGMSIDDIIDSKKYTNPKYWAYQRKKDEDKDIEQLLKNDLQELRRLREATLDVAKARGLLEEMRKLEMFVEKCKKKAIP